MSIVDKTLFSSEPIFRCPYCDYVGNEGLFHMRKEHPMEYEGDFVPHRRGEMSKSMDIVQSVTQNQLRGIKLMELMSRFSFHDVDDDGIQRMNIVRKAIHYAAVKIFDNVPDSREKELAMSRLQEAMYHANSAISLSYPTVTEEEIIEGEREE